MANVLYSDQITFRAAREKLLAAPDDWSVQDLTDGLGACLLNDNLEPIGCIVLYYNDTPDERLRISNNPQPSIIVALEVKLGIEAMRDLGETCYADQGGPDEGPPWYTFLFRDFREPEYRALRRRMEPTFRTSQTDYLR